MACQPAVPGALRLRHLLAGAAFLSCIPAALAAQTGNLLVNGDAESHLCTPDWSAQTPVPGWRVTRGAAAVLCYSAFERTHEHLALPAGSGGAALFSALGPDTAMEQVVDLSAAAPAIDQGHATFTLQGWLGGARNALGAILTAIFLDASGHAVGPPFVLAAGARAAAPGLAPRQLQGAVPRAARRAVVTVQFPSALLSFHEAFADNLVLRLQGDVPALAAAAPAVPASTVPALDHVFVVMMENTNFADVMQEQGGTVAVTARMPYLAALARDGVTLTQMWANYHPSDQNYVAMVAGDTFRYGGVYYPDFNLEARHVGDLLEARGLSWRAYAQGMKAACNLEHDPKGQGHYAPDVQPFPNFHNIIADGPRCRATQRDLADLAAAAASRTLPAFAWIAADEWWDGEGAWEEAFDVGFSLERQDEFLHDTLRPLLASDAWRQSRSLLVITWDESLGWGWPDNRIPTVLVGSPGLLRAGAVVTEHYDGYSVLRTVEEALGLDNLGRFDVHARPMNAAFAASEEPAGLEARAAAATRGSILETYGQVATPAAVRRGEVLPLRLAAASESASVVVVPLGAAPAPAAAGIAVPAGAEAVRIPTAALSPGAYGAWLRDRQGRLNRAPTPVIVLEPARILADHPGAQIVGAPATGTAVVREGSNILVRYCRPAGSDAAQSWIGLFPHSTPAARRTRQSAAEPGDWIKAPGHPEATGPAARCGEAMAYSARLDLDEDYDVQLYTQRKDGASAPVGPVSRFRVLRAAP